MNKGDLIDEVSKVLNTKKDAQAAVDCILSTITKALEKGTLYLWLDLALLRCRKERHAKEEILKPGKR